METTTEVRMRADNIHQQSVIVDAHHDILLDVFTKRNKGLRGRLNSYWAPKLMQGGVNVQVLPVYVDSEYLPESALRVTLRSIEAFHADLEDDSSIVKPAFSFADIENNLAQGRISALLGIEGVEGLGNNVDLFSTMHRLGVRVIGLTWNHRNSFADGTGEQDTGGGLTRAGFAAVREMNRLNMVIDLSHINRTCFFDVLATTDKPVIASHSNVSAIYDHPRNLTDAQIKALAKNGGVMGLLVHPGIIDPGQPTIARCVDHISYVADLVGVEHIGIGTDFMEDALAVPMDEEMARASMIPLEVLKTGIRGLARIEDLPNLTEELVRRGFTEDELKKILGQNFLRVFKAVLA